MTTTKTWRRRAVVALMWGWGIAAAAAAPDDPLPAPVAAALVRAGLPPDALGAIAIPRTRWARTWQHRADVPMQPGSSMKVVTTVVALDRLGPNHRGRTELYAAGSIDGELLAGDLVLKGSADPDLDLGALWRMLFELRQRGVREIAGDLVLDRTLFRPARIDLGMPPFDEAPERPYNVIPDALMLEDNLLGLALSSDCTGVKARTVLPLEGIELDSAALALTDAACADWSGELKPAAVDEPTPGQWRIALAGAFPRQCEARAALQLLDRNVLAERVVRAVWASLGGTWRQPPGRVREAATPEGATRVALHESRPWGEVMRPMNKRSDNALTRLLFLQLGVAGMAADPGVGTLELAQREVARWFDEQRIDRRSLVVDNGSGLSRSERIAPRAMARALMAALDGRHAPELLASLPVAGVDGTMRRRLRDTPAEGWARLKTATLKNVTGLAGTVRDTRGDTWVVVALVNHEQAARARPALDALIEWVARSGARWR